MPQLRLFGGVNSLAQLVLKATSPGVPDFYQGTELWDFSLVDPDNRRPVEYARRESMLAHVDDLASHSGAAAVAAEVTRDLGDGAIKLWTTAQVLRLRRDQHPVFRRGNYVPLYGAGAAEPHFIAHARQYEGKTVIVAVPRFACSLMRGELSLPLGKAWRDWVLPLSTAFEGTYRNIFTGEELRIEGDIPLGQLFANYPVAVLVTDANH
jgi:(1->4)-alpha-D-glucan 1-alpha-D-glucosylmutase